MKKILLSLVASISVFAGIAPVAFANVTSPMTQGQQMYVNWYKYQADEAVLAGEKKYNIQVSHNYFKIMELIAAGASQLGVPYKLDHQVAFDGFDCSNYVAWCYKQVGISFSGSSEYQRYHVGTPVPLDEIKPGDLLFFKTANNSTGGGHVGIAIGNGDVIQCGGGWGKVTEESLSKTWLGRNLVFARRVLN